MNQKTVAVIGGGPAGLMAAEVLSRGAAGVELFDSMPSLGRKLLMAGRGGLNLTHSEAYPDFVEKYGSRRREISAYLNKFTPADLRDWAQGLGVDTFVGTSGRVFPVKMKASPLLRAWLKRLQNNGVRFHTRHYWKGWNGKSLLFDAPHGERSITPDAVVLALGGASWPKLGSSGAWTVWLEQAGVRVEPFRPSNCGFDVDWSAHFREKYHGRPIKPVVLSFHDFKDQGEFIVTRTGVEGSLIYAASPLLRDEIYSEGSAVLCLDLAPDWSREKLAAALARPRGTHTLAARLEKSIGFKGVKVGLLHEFVSKEDLSDPGRLAGAIKALHIPLSGVRPIAEAISSAGGVKFEELDSRLMLKKIPGIFCAGEMLDWEAPTGGYLLTACLATGRAAGTGALEWLV